MHVQIIVSRKDITDRIKLSPQNTSRGKNKSHSAKLGQFNRMAFKESGERLFDKKFGFERNLKDSVQYANTMKNGTSRQQAQLYALNKAEEKYSPNQGIKKLNDLLSAIQQEDFKEMGDFFSSMNSETFGLFNNFSQVDYNEEENSLTEEERKRKHRKKNRGLQR